MYPMDDFVDNLTGIAMFGIGAGVSLWAMKNVFDLARDIVEPPRRRLVKRSEPEDEETQQPQRSVYDWGWSPY